MASSLHYVAEINHNKACFGFKPRQKPTLDVLDGASAAARVQEGAHAVLWLDLQSEAVFITERWGFETAQRRLPLNVCIDRQEPTAHDVDEEVSVAALQFLDRSPAELFGKLVLSVLPEWLAIRQSTAGRSLLVLADHWLISEEQQAVKLQHPDGHLSGLLQLDLQHAAIELLLMQDEQACRSYQVGCWDDVVKLLKKHSRPQERLDKQVHAALQELKPSQTRVGHLLVKLEATVNKHKGAATMAQWCRGGIMAALVDCAASLASSSSSSRGQQQRQSTSGYNDHRQQPAKRSSMPGAASQQACDSVARIPVLQALVECCCVVLACTAETQQQAELLVGCMGRALVSSMAEAVCIAQLLRMLLSHIGAKSPAACASLHQACCDLRLLHHVQHCYSTALPREQQQGRQLQLIVLSHQLEGLNADGASEPSTPSGGRAVVPLAAGPFDQPSAAGELSSCPDSPQLPQSPAAPPSRRHSLVPKLLLPVPVTPAPNSASRLSLESSGRAVGIGTCSRSVTDKATSGREPTGTSFLRAVQQLGHSCGQSVMAADLAAFVTHKQLLGGVVAVDATLNHSRPPSMSTIPGGDGTLSSQPHMGYDELSRLPLPAQLQVELLTVLRLLSEAPGSELVLPRSWEHLLLSPLLLPKAVWLQHGAALSGEVAGRECTGTDLAYRRIRAVTLKLMRHHSAMWYPCLPCGSSGDPQAVTPGGHPRVNLHHSGLEQFKMRLVAASSVQHPDASAHSLCAELLLLLRDYMRASQQAHLADTACFMLGGVLAQQEHMLRSIRMEHWPLEAVTHMDALVQLYVHLLGQVTSPAAAAWLLTVFGVQYSPGQSGTPLLPATGSSTESSSSPGPLTPAPADTLQLVLDYLQTYLTLMALAVDSHALSALTAAASGSAAILSGRSSNSTPHSKVVEEAGGGSSSASSKSLSVSVAAALQRMSQPPSSAGDFVMQLKANCWLLLGRLLQLAARQPALKAQGPPISPMCPRVLLSSSRSSASQQHPADACGSRTPCALASPKYAGSPMGRPTPLTGVRDTAERTSGSATPHKRPSLPLLALPNSGSFSRTPSASLLAAAGDSGDPLGALQAYCSASGDALAPGRCSLWQLLVELLMVNSSMGQATVLQHLAETHGNRLLLPLQQAVVDFLSTSLGMPDSYAFSKPQLAEFYVHHHFLHFTQHYHKLPTSPASGSAVLCKSHLQVLLALCHQTGGANQVRRRFLQLKVLEFLAREASLEYMCLHNLGASPGSSCCSTPLSTSRTANSYRTPSARGVTDPGAAAGAARAPAESSGRGLPPIALGALAGNGGPSREVSARGAGTSRLWVSSPGCQFSARSAQSTQRSWGGKPRNSADDVGKPPGSARSRQWPASAALLPPHSFELETFREEGKDLLLTGTSGLLTGTSTLLTGASSLQTGVSSVHTGGSNAARQEQLSAHSDTVAAPVPQLGSKVKAAVQALESAAAAVGPQRQPQPPKAPAAAAGGAGGRRQPGHRRLVCAVEPTNTGAAAEQVGPAVPEQARNLVVAAAAKHDQDQLGRQKSGRQSAQQQEQQQHRCPDGSFKQGKARAQEIGQQHVGAIAVPKLKLPGFGIPSSSSSPGILAGQAPDSSSSSPSKRPGLVVWQGLGGDPAGSADSTPRQNLSGPLCSPSSGSDISQLSPRADIEGYEVPTSVCSQRRVKQPKLTGDASYDNIIIDEWERQTGLEFQFDGLSDEEVDDSSSSGSSRSGSSSSSSTPRGVAPASPACQLAAATEAGQPGFGCSELKALLRPPTPEIAVLGQAAAVMAAGHDTWTVPALDMEQGSRPGRWISSSGSVEDATAADLTHFLGSAGLGLKGLAALEAVGAEHSPCLWATSYAGADSECSSPEARKANGAAADSDVYVSPVAAAAVAAGKLGGARSVPKLAIGGLGGLGSKALGVGCLPAKAETPKATAAAAAQGHASARQPAPSPGTYRPGWDLEEDFERLMEAGDWDDSDSCSDYSQAGSDAPQQQQLQLQLRPCPPLEPPPAQQQRRKLPALQLLQQQPESRPPQQQQQPDLAQRPIPPPASSPDTQAPTDVLTAKWRSPGRSKKQVVMGGAGRRVIVGPQAHALADCSCASSEEEVLYSSSDSELDSCIDRQGSGSGEAEADTHSGRASLSPARGGVVIPRLNLPQLQQPSWHLPMSATIMPSRDSSDAGLSNSQRTATSISRGGGGSIMSGLTVMPLTTTRPSCGGNDSSRSYSHSMAGPGPGSSRLAGWSARGSTGGWSQRGGDQGGVFLPAGQADYVPGTPYAAAAGDGGGPMEPAQAQYFAQRAKCAMYIDPELHVLCMELALHLLVTPTGQLDFVQLPQEPSDTSLQRKVLLLLEHLSDAANLGMTCCLAQRACTALQQRRQQQQHPLPLCSTSSSSPDQQPQQDLTCVAAGPGVYQCTVTGLHNGALNISCSSTDAAMQRLRDACTAVRDSSTFIRPSYSGGGSSTSGSSGLGHSSTAAADAAAGLAGSTLRLLKLLCLPVLDLSRLNVGSMISKGAFSEVLSGTLYQAGSGGDGMPVALKVMDCSEDDACSFERVYNEVASLEAMRGHPAVVPLLEYGITSSISGGRQWVLVFPRYAGSLREWRLKWRGRGLDARDLPVYLRLFLQVARAVAALHASNVVHFDIKGDNVLLQQGFSPASLHNSSSGSCPSAPSSSRASSRLSSSDVVLADFGDALMLENAHASSQRHRGTELFSSPEMLLLHAGRQHAQHAQHDRRKHRGVHAAHDVWSLGCTLYELLTGSVLFEDEGVGRITSYSSSQSSGGGAHGAGPHARGWGVLSAREKAALQQHTGCIELVESMLVGEPNWRPSADQVVVKAQRLLVAVLSNSNMF